MSDNIYDILGKLNGLAPKENPMSTAEPIYESVDPRGDIMSAVTQLEERYMGFKEAKDKRREPEAVIPDSDLTRSADPDVARLATKAKFIKPELNDFEAIVSYTSKLEKELEKAEQADVVDREKIEQTQQMLAKNQAGQDALRKVITATDQRFRALNDKVAAGQVTQQDQKAAQVAQQIEKDHDAAVAAIPQEPQQQTTAAPQQPTADIYQFPSKEEPVSTQTTTTAANDQPPPEQELPAGVTSIASRTRKTQPKQKTGDTLMRATPLARAVGQNESKENKLKMLREYKEGDPDLGLINYNEALKAFQNAQEKITLDFGNGKLLTLYDYQLYGLLTDLTTDQNQERKMARVESVMSNYDSIVQLLMTPKVKKLIQKFPEYAKKNPRFKTRMRDVNRDQFKLEPAPPQDPRYDPRIDPSSPEFDQAYAATQSHPYQRSDSQLEENLGNIKMKKPNSILEAVMQVEEGKKLKDKKQFDDSAKTGDYYITSKGNKVIKTDTGVKHEKVYAGDDDKDDLDESSYSAKAARAGKDIGKPGKEFAKIAKSAGERYGSKERGEKVAGAVLKKLRADEGEEVDESGLQAYLGKKKYGKEGMKALQKAGREGASKEKMALIRAKHDKMDEAAKPDYIDLDKDGNKTEPMKQAAKDAKKVDEVAPPGAKAERMVKHIKKGYAKDGKLTPKEKGIAYATAWKAHNKGQVEEGTEFGDTIKNSAGKMTKVTVKEGKEAIRNHPIYTTKEAWDHYAQELAEQEAMESSMMEAPVVDVQQELDEIAKLAGLPVKTCESCGCAESACKCNENLAPMAPADSASPLTHTELDEAATRKDFRMVADLIKQNPDREKAKELAHHHADIFKQQNPRFKREMFLAACGLEECDMTPTAVIVGEDEMEEGNEFSGALAKARAAGAKDFEVDGKKYTVKEDINVNISANGEEDAVKLIQKLAGMPVIAVQASPAGAEEVAEQMEEEPKERDIEYTNTPREETAGADASFPGGTDLNRPKKSYSDKPYRGDNPMAESKEESLWSAYESLINDIKA